MHLSMYSSTTCASGAIVEIWHTMLSNFSYSRTISFGQIPHCKDQIPHYGHRGMSNAPGWGKGLLSISLVRVQLNRFMYGHNNGIIYVICSSIIFCIIIIVFFTLKILEFLDIHTTCRFSVGLLSHAMLIVHLSSFIGIFLCNNVVVSVM